MVAIVGVRETIKRGLALFDNGVLRLGVTRLIESQGKPGVRELECCGNLPWQGQWRRIEAVGVEGRPEPRESFGPVPVRCGKGESKT